MLRHSAKRYCSADPSTRNSTLKAETGRTQGAFAMSVVEQKFNKQTTSLVWKNKLPYSSIKGCRLLRERPMRAASCSHGTPPASVFKVHIWIFATTTKICNICNFALTFIMCLTTNICTLLHITYSCRIDRMVSVARVSAIHFRGQSIRQVSCYTFLSGFQLPWPPSCC